MSDSSLILAHLLHLVVSSILVFFAVALLMEGCLFIFRIKSPRIRATCRSLLILKLPLDMFLRHLFPKEAFINFNPFSCMQYLEKFIINLLPAHLKGSALATADPSLANLMATHIPSLWLKTFLIGIILISAFLFGRVVLRLFKSTHYLNTICRSAQPCLRTITNEQLRNALKKSRVSILMSADVSTPFAAKRHTILFPNGLVKELSQDEFEAVVAHELEHLRWCDPMARLVNSILTSLFWWIPMQRWIKKLEEEQEQASDLSIINYRLDHHALATALVKTASKGVHVKYPVAALCRLVSQKSLLFRRLKTILEDNSAYLLNRPLPPRILESALVSSSLILFWIC